MVQLEQLDHKGILVLLVLMELLVLTVQLVQLDHKDLRVILVLQVQVVRQVLGV